MADRIITVTNPSVVTNDTLAGYNNYSDIDGQLGTTMTPTEATNGKTVALTDGLVHEVTTKPVGTTNGEFSAVVSNAVTVDLSVATTYGIQTHETPDNSYILFDDAFIPATGDWEAGLVFDDISGVAGSHIIGIAGRDFNAIDGGRINLKANGSSLDATYELDLKWWAGGSGNTSVNSVSVTPGEFVELRRVGDELSIWVDNVKTTVTGDLDTSYAYTAGRHLAAGGYGGTQRNLDMGVTMTTILGDTGIIPTTQSSGATIAGTTYTATLQAGTLAGGADSMYYTL